MDINESLQSVIQALTESDQVNSDINIINSTLSTILEILELKEQEINGETLTKVIGYVDIVEVTYKQQGYFLILQEIYQRLLKITGEPEQQQCLIKMISALTDYQKDHNIAEASMELRPQLKNYQRFVDGYQLALNESSKLGMQDQVVHNLLKLSDTYVDDFSQSNTGVSRQLTLLEQATTTALAAHKMCNTKERQLNLLIPKVVYAYIKHDHFNRLIFLNENKPEELKRIFSSLSKVIDVFCAVGELSAAQEISQKLIAFTKQHTLEQALIKENIPKFVAIIKQRFAIESVTMDAWMTDFLSIYNYQAHLKKIRDASKSKVKTTAIGQPMREHLQNFTLEMDNFIKELFIDCFKILGMPPRQYAILALGSLSRNEMCPYSDLEFAILIEDNWKSDSVKYFALWLQLLTVKVAALGETPSKNVETKLLKKGFRLDDGGNIPFGASMQLIGTVSELIAKLQPIDIGADDFLRPESMDGSNALWFHRHLFGDKNLTSKFRAELDKLKYKQDYALYMLRDCLINEDFEAFADDAKEISIKPKLLSFVSFILSDLCLYHGISVSNNYKRLEELRQRNLLSVEISQLLTFYLDIVFNLRFSTHNKYQEEHEDLIITDANRRLLTTMRDVILQPLRIVAQQFLDTKDDDVFLNNELFQPAHTFCEQLDQLAYYQSSWVCQFNARDLQARFYPNNKQLSELQSLAKKEEKAMQAIMQARRSAEVLGVSRADRSVDLDISSDIVSAKVIAQYQDLYELLLQLETVLAENIIHELSLALPDLEYKTVLCALIACYIRNDQNRAKRHQLMRFVVSMVPEQDGMRVKIKEEIAVWDDKFAQLLEEKNNLEQNLIAISYLDLFGNIHEKFLKPEVTKQLFNKHMKFKGMPGEHGGRHILVPVEVGNVKFWWKIKPEAPGISFAAEQLTLRLTGGGIAKSTVARLEINGKIAAVQIIEDAGSKDSLSSRIAKNISDVSLLDTYSYSQHMIRVLLLNPEDDKADDYFFIKSIRDNSYDLIRIDNERYFYAAENRTPGIFYGTYKSLIVKSIVLLLAKRRENIDNKIIKEFSVLSVQDLITAWVRLMQKVVASYAELFNLEVVKDVYKNSKDKCLLIVPFRQEYILTLYNSIQLLHTYFTEKKLSNQNIEGVELIKYINDVLGKYYLETYKEINSYKQYEEFMRHFYSRSNREFRSSLSPHASLNSGKRLSGQYLTDVFRNEKDSFLQVNEVFTSIFVPHSSESFKESILNGNIGHLEQLQFDQQNSLLNEVLSGAEQYNNLQKITILNSVKRLTHATSINLSKMNSVLSDEYLRGFFEVKFDRLVHIDISECRHLTDDHFRMLASSLVNIMYLKAKNLQLTQIGSAKIPVIFPKLVELNLSGSRSLRFLFVNCYELKTLILDNTDISFESIDASFCAKNKLEYLLLRDSSLDPALINLYERYPFLVGLHLYQYDYVDKIYALLSKFELTARHIDNIKAYFKLAGLITPFDSVDQYQYEHIFTNIVELQSIVFITRQLKILGKKITKKDFNVDTINAIMSILKYVKKAYQCALTEKIKVKIDEWLTQAENYEGLVQLGRCIFNSRNIEWKLHYLNFVVLMHNFIGECYAQIIDHVSLLIVTSNTDIELMEAAASVYGLILHAQPEHACSNFSKLLNQMLIKKVFDEHTIRTVVDLLQPLNAALPKQINNQLIAEIQRKCKLDRLTFPMKLGLLELLVFGCNVNSNSELDLVKKLLDDTIVNQTGFMVSGESKLRIIALSAHLGQITASNIDKILVVLLTIIASKEADDRVVRVSIQLLYEIRTIVSLRELQKTYNIISSLDAHNLNPDLVSFTLYWLAQNKGLQQEVSAQFLENTVELRKARESYNSKLSKTLDTMIIRDKANIYALLNALVFSDAKASSKIYKYILIKKVLVNNPYMLFDIIFNFNLKLKECRKKDELNELADEIALQDGQLNLYHVVDVDTWYLHARLWNRIYSEDCDCNKYDELYSYLKKEQSSSIRRYLDGKLPDDEAYNLRTIIKHLFIYAQFKRLGLLSQLLYSYANEGNLLLGVVNPQTEYSINIKQHDEFCTAAAIDGLLEIKNRIFSQPHVIELEVNDEPVKIKIWERRLNFGRDFFRSVKKHLIIELDQQNAIHCLPEKPPGFWDKKGMAPSALRDNPAAFIRRYRADAECSFDCLQADIMKEWYQYFRYKGMRISNKHILFLLFAGSLFVEHDQSISGRFVDCQQQQEIYHEFIRSYNELVVKLNSNRLTPSRGGDDAVYVDFINEFMNKNYLSDHQSLISLIKRWHEYEADRFYIVRVDQP